jgi:hypothetical protein
MLNMIKVKYKHLLSKGNVRMVTIIGSKRQNDNQNGLILVRVIDNGSLVQKQIDNTLRFYLI